MILHLRSGSCKVHLLKECNLQLVDCSIFYINEGYLNCKHLPFRLFYSDIHSKPILPTLSKVVREKEEKNQLKIQFLKQRPMMDFEEKSKESYPLDWKEKD